MENLSLSVPDLLKTVKQFVQPDKHGQLDQMLNRYLSKELGKQQLQLELRSVAGRDALRQALLAMVPQIDELQKKRELMKRSGPPPQRPTPMGMPQQGQLPPGTVQPLAQPTTVQGHVLPNQPGPPPLPQPPPPIPKPVIGPVPPQRSHSQVGLAESAVSGSAMLEPKMGLPPVAHPPEYKPNLGQHGGQHGMGGVNQNRKSTLPVQALVHAFHCNEAGCRQKSCVETKQVLKRMQLHVETCKIRAQGASSGQPAECKVCKLWQALLSRGQRPTPMGMPQQLRPGTVFLAMSAPPRRRSRRLASSSTAAPSPDTPPPARLLDLPTDLLVRAFSRCDPADIARVAAVSLLFHASLAEEGIRLRLQEAGYELPAQPEGESCAVRWLCSYALLREYNPPVRLAAGDMHSVFIDNEGRLSSCGSEEGGEDEYGQEEEFPGLLGQGEDVLQLKTPTRLPSLRGEHAIGVAASRYFSLALAADGAVWSWGRSWEGELGHGDTQDQLLPKKVEAFAGQRVVAVSAGSGHSIALTADGAVWSWGLGRNGQLGHGDTQSLLLPIKIEAFAGTRVVAVSAGYAHNLSLTADGAVWSWGDGDYGRLGHGDEERQLLPKKIEAFAGQHVVAVSAGGGHSLALTADGAVWSWGLGRDGQLGQGNLQNQLLPRFVGQRVVAVSAGGNHSLALTADGAVWSWGEGDYGQLGHGNERNQPLPKKVGAFAGQRVVAVSAGRFHSLASTADGAVFTWGDGEDGCLGHGEDLSNQLLPKKVEAWCAPE